MNLGTIRTNVASVLGMKNTVAGDQTLIDQWANEAVTDILLQTDIYVKCADMTLTVDEADYDLAASIFKIRYAYLDPVSGDNRLMERRSPMEILDYRIGTANNSGQPYLYALQGANMFMVYPTPNAADLVHVYYVPKPTALAAAGDDPSGATLGGIPTQYHDLIVDYALWRAADFEEGQGTHDPEKYAQRYLMGIKDIMRDLNRKGGVRAAPAIRARTRARGLSFNDVYPR